MPTYYVVVSDSTTRRYFVEAESEDEARDIVEGDTDGLTAFGNKLIDSSWDIESITLAPGDF